MARVMVVEDEPRLASMLEELLTMSGHEVTTEARGDLTVERALVEDPDLVLLDVGLPGMDGFEVCRRLRPQFEGGILILTARGDALDEVVGLDAGADGYLAKPVEPQRLLAHVRAVLRRTAPPAPRRLELGDLVVDAGQRAAWLEGRALSLGSTEFDLLWRLAVDAGHAVPRDALHETLRGTAWDGLDRTVDLRISRLRRALGDPPQAPRWLLTVRGIGYQLAPA
ncbi:MAG TPA: response regulator transcription factor [Deltaproteobacteria bacterium]|nr:response regulator transcription factor [Deltaproteobacteria bacterium]